MAPARFVRPSVLAVDRPSALGTALLLAAPAVGQQILPISCPESYCGKWLPYYNWCPQFVTESGDPANCTHRTIGHAALIPVGNHAGKVLLWNLYSAASGGACTVTDETFLFDPSNPAQLIKILHSPLQTNIFCSGMSWDPNGNLVVVGGEDGENVEPGHPPPFPKRAYRFLPRALPTLPQPPTNPPTVAGRCWEPAGENSIRRNYASVVTFSRRAMSWASTTCIGSLAHGPGGAFVIGGRPSQQHGNEIFDYLSVDATAWGCALRPLIPIDYPPYALPQIPDPTQPGHKPFFFNDHLAGMMHPLGEYELRKASSDPLDYPEVDLESYPRAFQLSTGEIFVAGDRDKLATAGAPQNSPGHVDCEATVRGPASRQVGAVGRSARRRPRDVLPGPAVRQRDSHVHPGGRVRVSRPRDCARRPR
jgi:hypothetical protein